MKYTCFEYSKNKLYLRNSPEFAHRTAIRSCAGRTRLAPASPGCHPPSCPDQAVFSSLSYEGTLLSAVLHEQRL